MMMILLEQNKKGESPEDKNVTLKLDEYKSFFQIKKSKKAFVLKGHGVKLAPRRQRGGGDGEQQEREAH